MCRLGSLFEVCSVLHLQIKFGNRALPFFVPLLKLRSDNRCQNQFLMSLWTDPQCLFGWTISKHLTLGFGIDRCCFRRPDARSNITDFGKFWNSVVQCNAAIIWCLTYRPSLNIMTDWLILTTSKHLNYSNDFDLHLPFTKFFFSRFCRVTDSSSGFVLIGKPRRLCNIESWNDYDASLTAPVWRKWLIGLWFWQFDLGLYAC